MSSIELDIRPTFGAVFAGLVAAAVFYGVTVLQTILYFQTYPDDLLFIRLLVAFIWALDTLSLALITHTVWRWLVIGFMNPSSLVNIPVTLKIEPMVTATMAFFVHLFMAHRIKLLDSRKGFTVIAGVIALVSFFPWIMGILTVYYGLTVTGGFAEIHEKLSWVTISANTSSAMLDITILVVFCAQLKIVQTDVSMKRTSRVIHLLTIYVVSNNLLTSFLTVADTISFFAAPDTLINLAIYVTLSKAYANTFMAQLNARQSIRRRGEEVGLQASSFRIETGARSQELKDAFEMGHYQSVKQPSSSQTAV